MPLSTTSMVVYNDSLDHLPLGFVIGTLFVLVDLCILFDIGASSLYFFVCPTPHLSPMKDFEHHDALNFRRPNLQKLGGMRLGPTSGTHLSFLCLDQENKKCIGSENLCNPYSCVKTLVSIITNMFAKSV